VCFNTNSEEKTEYLRNESENVKSGQVADISLDDLEESTSDILKDLNLLKIHQQNQLKMNQLFLSGKTA